MTSGFKFEEIGLDNRDKRVYEALLAKPQSSLRTIAANTSINRGSVYESIKRLLSQGLVGSIQIGKQRRYSASEPRAIIQLLQERQDQAIAAQLTATHYISSLEAIKPPVETPQPFARFYEDHEGIAAVLRDVIATCSSGERVGYRVISTKEVRTFMYHNFANFTQRRIAEKIPVKVIAVEEGGVTEKFSERRWLTPSRGKSPNCYTIIYGTKTAFISKSETNVLLATVIDNEGVADLQKELFDRIWKSL